MRLVLTIFMLIFLTMALLACQANNSTGTVPQEPPALTQSPGSLPENSETPSSSPTLPQEDINMTPVTPPDEAAEKMVTLVKQHLAQKLSITAEQIVLSNVKPVVWRDAGLGCPKPGVDYIQVETPGYNILLEAGGKTYTYHTDKTKRFVQCNM